MKNFKRLFEKKKTHFLFGVCLVMSFLTVKKNKWGWRESPYIHIQRWTFFADVFPSWWHLLLLLLFQLCQSVWCEVFLLFYTLWVRWRRLFLLFFSRKRLEFFHRSTLYVVNPRKNGTSHFCGVCHNKFDYCASRTD